MTTLHEAMAEARMEAEVGQYAEEHGITKEEARAVRISAELTVLRELLFQIQLDTSRTYRALRDKGIA
jgi:hypothetical protein